MPCCVGILLMLEALLRCGLLALEGNHLGLEAGDAVFEAIHALEQLGGSYAVSTISARAGRQPESFHQNTQGHNSDAEASGIHDSQPPFVTI
jgi:hypothetical protein